MLAKSVRTNMRRLLRCWAWISVSMVCVPAWAQTQKTPEELFNEAKVDADAKRFEEACPKFEASYRVSQKAGALLSWADCEENRNRLATSLRLWEEGAGKVADDAERSRYVAARLDRLRPRVPHVSIEIGAPDAKVWQVSIDGRVVEPSAGPFAVDPGEHVIVAKAAGKETQTRAVTAEAGRDQSVSVPVLSSATKAPEVRPLPVSPAQPASRDSRASLRIAGWTVSSIGLAGALAFGGTAIAVRVRCNHEGLSGDGDDLGGHGCPTGSKPLLVGNAVALGVGVAGLGVGVGLLIAGYTKRDEPSRVALVSGPGDLGLGLSWSLGRP